MSVDRSAAESQESTCALITEEEEGGREEEEKEREGEGEGEEEGRDTAQLVFMDLVDNDIHSTGNGER